MFAREGLKMADSLAHRRLQQPLTAVCAERPSLSSEPTEANGHQIDKTAATFYAIIYSSVRSIPYLRAMLQIAAKVKASNRLKVI